MAEGKQSCSADAFRHQFLRNRKISEPQTREVSCLFVHGIYQAGSTQETVGRNQRKGPVRLNFRSSCLPGNYRQSPKLDRKTERNRPCLVETQQ